MDEKVRFNILISRNQPPPKPKSPLSANHLSNKPQKAFTPPLPPSLSFHLSIHDAALVLHLRTLTPATSSTPDSSFSLRSRLGLATPPPSHDEMGQTFVYRGQEVRVREKVRVESQDPSLMAVMAKLSAVGHGVRVCRRALGVVMEEGDEEE